MEENDKIRMPKKLLNKWLKALESGEYKQARGTLYKPSTGGFCCLGVLQHVASGGSCEVDIDGDFMNIPSEDWYEDNNIDMSAGAQVALIALNDGEYSLTLNRASNRKRFNTIAKFIRENAEGI